MVTLEKNTVSQEKMSQNESCSHQEATVGRTHSTHIPSSHFSFLSGHLLSPKLPRPGSQTAPTHNRQEH